MFSKSNPYQFPVWHYLNQPLFHRNYQVVLHPQRFWHFYNVALLERCLNQDCPLKDHHRD